MPGVPICGLKLDSREALERIYARLDALGLEATVMSHVCPLGAAVGRRGVRWADCPWHRPTSPRTGGERVYRIVTDVVSPDEFWYAVGALRRGPFVRPEVMEDDLVDLVAAWNRVASELGGHVRRRLYVEIVVWLPRGVPIDGPDRPWPA